MTLSVPLDRGGGPGWVFRGGPCLDVDFVGNRSWNGSADGLSDDYLTTTRTTTGYVDDANGLWTSIGTGTLRRSDKGSLNEPARTNVVLWCRDLSNAAWTKSNTTAAKTQVGRDGVANSASLVTATSSNGTVLQGITLASSARFQSAFVKRVTGTGVVSMTMDNGSTWTVITVTDTDFWSRVTIPTQTLADPTVGFKLATNGDAIAVDFVQNENDGLLASSPILTTTVAVTRNADQVVMTTPPTLAGVAYTIYAEVVPNTPITYASDQYILSVDDGSTDNRMQLYRLATTGVGTFKAVAATVSLASIAGAALAQDTAYRIIGTGRYGNYQAGQDGTLGTAATTATDPPALTAIRIGSDSAGANQFFGYIKRIAVWNGLAFTDDQLTWATS